MKKRKTETPDSRALSPDPTGLGFFSLPDKGAIVWEIIDALHFAERNAKVLMNNMSALNRVEEKQEYERQWRKAKELLERLL